MLAAPHDLKTVTPRRATLRWALALAAVAVALMLGFHFGRPPLERSLRLLIEQEGVRHGILTRVHEVRISPLPAVVVHDLSAERAGQVRITVDEIVIRPEVSWQGFRGRAAVLDVTGVAVAFPGELQLRQSRSRWRVTRGRGELGLTVGSAGESLSLRAFVTPLGTRIEATAARFPFGTQVDLLFRDCPLLDPGVVDGKVEVADEGPGRRRARAAVHLQGLRVVPLGDLGTRDCAERSLGVPNDVQVDAEGVSDTIGQTLNLERLRVVAGDVEAEGNARVEPSSAGPRVEISLDAPRLDLARILAAAGLDLPADDLGMASLSVRASGPLLDLAEMQVTERLEFTPPNRPLPAIERLAGPFVHEVMTSDGRLQTIDVSPESPAFVALGEVPPHFLRALLLAEDSNFYGHKGIDLRELPVAVATNLKRGGFSRGASTIPQQLAKNLLLSRRKTMSRKVEEAALALLLDSRLGKQRELEIYLNVIEWGPGLYGLRPAAHHYFGCSVSDLTPKQMVFLITLIPGPIKYQRSIASGTPSPTLEGMMAALLAKLLSVGAMSEADYQGALAESLLIRSSIPNEEAESAQSGDEARSP